MKNVHFGLQKAELLRIVEQSMVKWVSKVVQQVLRIYAAFEDFG
jgi:hypothetical protein